MSEDPTANNTSAAPPAADVAPSVEYTNSNEGGGESNVVEAIRLPTPEEIRWQDSWNNCAVRSCAIGVMGFCSYFYFIIIFEKKKKNDVMLIVNKTLIKTM